MELLSAFLEALLVLAASVSGGLFAVFVMVVCAAWPLRTLTAVFVIFLVAMTAINMGWI